MVWHTLKLNDKNWARLEAIAKALSKRKSEVVTDLLDSLHELVGGREANLMYHVEILNDRMLILKIRRKRVTLK